MTTPDTEQTRQTRQETAAALEEHARLADAARREVITLVCDSMICRDGAENALHAWGLDPIPQAWTVLADGELSYRLLGPAHGSPERLYQQILAEAHRVLPAMAFWLGRAGDPATRDDQPGDALTMPVMLRINVTATAENGVLTAAQQQLSDGLPALTGAGITVTNLSWCSVSTPRDLDRADLLDYAHTPVDIPAAPLPDNGDDPGVAARTRDDAIQRLDTLRRRIRERAIRALRTDEIGLGVQDTGDLLDPILIRLGLDRLPRAHRVAVTADLTLRLPTVSADRAFALAYELMRGFVERSDRSWHWTRSSCTITSALPARDADRWPIPWRLEYTTLVRGHPDPADPSGAAETAVRAALTGALNAWQYDATITASSLNHGYDPNPDPGTD